MIGEVNEKILSESGFSGFKDLQDRGVVCVGWVERLKSNPIEDNRGVPFLTTLSWR